VFYAIIFYLILVSMPRKINWAESFSRLHTIPFGCYVLYEELDILFPEAEIFEFTDPIYNSMDGLDVYDHTYISINRDWGADNLDMEALLEFVARGNSTFISAEQFPSKLLDTLGLQLGTEWQSVSFSESPTSKREWIQNELTLESDPIIKWIEQRDFNYVYLELDSANVQSSILGRIDSIRANFVGTTFGNGMIFLNTSPFMFTNFNLLEADNHGYIAGCLSYAGGGGIIWDEYYKAGRTKYAQSPLATLLKDRSFRIAIYVALIGILLFMVFHAKRRQRIIPVLKPYENTSLEFARTLGDLYYEQGNHSDLATKKVAYLKDYLHETYRMNNITFREDEIPFVARRSGHSESFIKSLYQIIGRVELGEKITAQILEGLNQKLQDFYFRKDQYGE
jgi:hypothetical protein